MLLLQLWREPEMGKRARERAREGVREGVREVDRQGPCRRRREREKSLRGG